MGQPPNTLYYGDNLDILRRDVDDESVDLIYLDPPFSSNADWAVPFAAAMVAHPGARRSACTEQAAQEQAATPVHRRFESVTGSEFR